MIDRLVTLIGFAFILPWRKERFVPGRWTPRYDRHGRIYMLLSPDEDIEAAQEGRHD